MGKKIPNRPADKIHGGIDGTVLSQYYLPIRYYYFLLLDAVVFIACRLREDHGP